MADFWDSAGKRPASTSCSRVYSECTRGQMDRAQVRLTAATLTPATAQSVPREISAHPAAFTATLLVLMLLCFNSRLCYTE